MDGPPNIVGLPTFPVTVPSTVVTTKSVGSGAETGWVKVTRFRTLDAAVGLADWRVIEATWGAVEVVEMVRLQPPATEPTAVAVSSTR